MRAVSNHSLGCGTKNDLVSTLSEKHENFQNVFVSRALCCHNQKQVVSALIAMGSSQSRTSFTKISNDFELVIRATKELEFLLETEFDAPTGKTIGLHDKISDVEHSFGLSRPTVQKMRYLVTGAYH